MIAYVGTVRLDLHGAVDFPPELERVLEALGYRATHVPAAVAIDVDRAHAVRVLGVLLDQIVADANAR